MNPSLRRAIPAAAVLLGLLAIAGPVSTTQATSLVYYGTEKLLADCDFVILGKVVADEADFHDARYAGEDREIYTYTTLDVIDSWGWAGAEPFLTLEEIGGQAGSVVSIVDGVPRFFVGEEVLVFVERRPDGHYKTFGMFLGALPVLRDGAGARLIRPSTPEGTTAVEAGLGADIVPPGPDGRFALDPFVDAIAHHYQAEGRR
ncbi:MAG: hypothetical protein ACE15D_11475 [Candidatus Eisenbacteria bacterium]